MCWNGITTKTYYIEFYMITFIYKESELIFHKLKE
jgi:hypothetical protein